MSIHTSIYTCLYTHRHVCPEIYIHIDTLVCVHISVHTCQCTRVYIRMSICACLHAHVYMHVYTHVYTPMSIHTRVYTHVYIHMSIHACLCVYTCLHTHVFICMSIYTCLYTNVCTHTSLHTCVPSTFSMLFAEATKLYGRSRIEPLWQQSITCPVHSELRGLIQRSAAVSARQHKATIRQQHGNSTATTRQQHGKLLIFKTRQPAGFLGTTANRFRRHHSQPIL